MASTPFEPEWYLDGSVWKRTEVDLSSAIGVIVPDATADGQALAYDQDNWRLKSGNMVGTNSAINFTVGSSVGLMRISSIDAADFELEDYGATANSQRFLIRSDGGTLIFRSLTDAGATTSTFFTASSAGAVNMTGATSVTVPAATADGQALNRITADGRYVNTAGDTMTGALTVPSLNLTSSNAALRPFTSGTDAGLSALMEGTTSGTVLEGPINAHFVLDIENNGSQDSFYITSRSSNIATDPPNRVAFRVDAAGAGTFLGTVSAANATANNHLMNRLTSDQRYVPFTTIAGAVDIEFGSGFNLTFTEYGGATSLTIGSGVVTLGGKLDANAKSIENLGAIERQVNTVAASGATETLDTSLYGVHDVTMNQNCTFTFSNPAPSGDHSSFELILRGAFAPTFPGSVGWPGDEPFYESPSRYNFSTVDGGTTWFGSQVGSGGSDGFSFIQDTAPAAYASGQTWFDTETGLSYVWYTDANTSQWVQFAQGGSEPVATDWTAVTFQNSWVNYGSVEQVVQYRKLGDRVELRGACKNGTLTSTAFTLPVGFRPPANLGFAVAGFESPASYPTYNVFITSSGEVQVRSAGNDYVAFDGIFFSVTA